MHIIVRFQSPVLSVTPKIRSFKAPLLPSPLQIFSSRFHGLWYEPISSSLHGPKKTTPNSAALKSTASNSANLKTPIPKTAKPKSTKPKSRLLTAKPNPSVSTEFLDTQDWSFLNQSSSWTNENMATVVAAAQLEEDSKVVVCMGTEQFVNYLSSVSPSITLSVLHYSLTALADVKEQHDSVRCRQGDIMDMPPSWGALDVVFMNYLPALICALPQMFQTLVKRCAPGARVIISDTQGRAQLNANKESYPNVITGDLPDKVELEKLLQGHPVQLVSFRDEPDFYFAVLKVL